MRNQRTFTNIFALGDVAQTALNEEKTVYPLKKCAKIVAENIRTLANGENKPLKELPDKFAGIYQLSLGKNDGILIINDFVLCGKMIANQKAEYERMHLASYKGDARAKR